MKRGKRKRKTGAETYRKFRWGSVWFTAAVSGGLRCRHGSGGGRLQLDIRRVGGTVREPAGTECFSRVAAD